MNMPIPLRWSLALATAVAVLAAALAAGSGGWDAGLILALRWPRVLAAAGVGALLALAGLVMQVLLRNPLADPYVLGTSGGASVGALAALLAGASQWVGAGAGALGAGALLLLLARSALAATDDASPRLILVGAMLAALFGAVATLLLMLTPDERLRGAIFWLVGDLSAAQDGGLCVAGAALLMAGLLWRGHSVDRLMLGAEVAGLLGEPVRRLRFELLVAASLAVGLAVATAGAVGFIGLVVPQAWRLAGVHHTRELAGLSALGGATLLVGADLAARMVAAPMELPVGAVMALLGAPCFIALLVKGAR
ncbi:iron ABC transporter permease [Ideonella sp.]|uniref:FecCD family ABC transporter permease n=1 Tax=Ideonella sp. TaxID=1929293 RepID=UPI002B495255|nr:iron ABC transporter permease [Ideonella sp.]HJV67548.1 iron ABC transporter permease [Ideonella sp.]